MLGHITRPAVAALLILGLTVAACAGENAPPTPSPEPSSTTAPSPTPSPLLTLDEARKFARDHALEDADTWREVAAKYPELFTEERFNADLINVAVACLSESDRYSIERRTWVLNCQWVDISEFSPVATVLATQLTAIAAGTQQTLSPIPGATTLRPNILHEKTYLVDDNTGRVIE